MFTALILDCAYADGALAFERGYTRAFVPACVQARGPDAVAAFRRGYDQAESEALREGSPWLPQTLPAGAGRFMH